MTSDQVLAGMIGGLITALLGGLVRAFLDHRSAAKAREHVAYVRFIQINDFLAMCRSTIVFVKEIFGKNPTLRPINDLAEIDLSFILTALLASEIVDCGGFEVHDAAARKLSGILLTLVESIEEAKVSTDDLARLPLPAITPYHDYVGQLSALRSVLRKFIASLNDSPPTLPLTANEMQTAWRQIQRLATSATKLHQVMARVSGLSTSETENLLGLRRAEYDSALHQAFSDFEKLQAIDKAIAGVKSASAVPLTPAA